MKIPTRFTLINKHTGYYISDRYEKLSSRFNPISSLLTHEENDDGSYTIKFERTELPLLSGFHSDITVNASDVATRGEWEVELIDPLYNLCKFKHKETGEYLKCGSLQGNGGHNNDSSVWSIISKEDVAQVDLRMVSNNFACNDEQLTKLKKAAQTTKDNSFFEELNAHNEIIGKMVELASKTPADRWLPLESSDGISWYFGFGENQGIMVTQQNNLSDECKGLCTQHSVNLDDYATKVQFVVQYTTSRGTTVQTILANSISLITSMAISQMLISGFVAMFERVVGGTIAAISESGLISVESAMATEMAYMRCMSWLYSPGWVAGGVRFLARMSIYALVGYVVLITIVPFLIRDYKYQLLVSNFTKSSLLRIKVPYVSNVDNSSKYKDINEVLQPVTKASETVTINGFEYKVLKNMVSQGLIYFGNDNTFLEGMSELVTVTETDADGKDAKESICLMTDIPRFSDNKINAVSNNGKSDFSNIFAQNISEYTSAKFDNVVVNKRVEFNMLPSLSGAENNSYNSVCNIYDS
ncbi:hypothetical protein RND59_15930 [Vibrio ruber]|uniref:hypothetical protein n=1 Tax=Vibrio ruber TaxID=184755 RepID=UPI0028931955|nr:hypothetical protein [Vibrio ruber]WNJ97622.1 hypothetical protein RND59_15930 [Vibrio ruber]